MLQIHIPDHAVEEDVMAIKAVVRPDEAVGSVVTKWLGRMNRVPAIIDSLPDPQRRNKEGLLVHDKSLKIHLDTRDAESIVRKYGRNGCLARIIHIQLMEAKAGGPGMKKNTTASLRVKPQSVAVNAATQRIEHIGFIYAPKDRWLKVDIPIRLINIDSSVGLKKGGWHMLCRRTVSLHCRGDSIPPFIELDVKNMLLDHRMVVSDLISQLPQGTKLCPQDLAATVVKCTNEQGDEIKRWGELVERT
jgi:large subunit ribosomal protein L25